MKLKWNKLTATTGVVAVFLFLAGAVFLYRGFQKQREFESWETAIPMRCAVDLSKPGKFKTQFKQTCSSSHGEAVVLRLPSETMDTNSFHLLVGLEATLEIKSLSSTNQVETTSFEFVEGGWFDFDALPIFSINPFSKGEYEAHINVISGASALAGKKQLLEGRYLLCGSEALPALISITFGAALGLAGILFGAITFFFARRSAKRCQP